ncbi:MAG: DNA mismatch endonuclease Vsr, partial [Sphaerochaetaceae bacterium]|nr:DNA mismatch endonuclease Vsr [Sphaerochaetaceae bacterium]
KDLPGKPDIILPKYRTVVFVHGCFWHRHENCKYSSIPNTHTEFWEEKFRRNVERDQQNIADLESLGWKVVVVWECEVKDHSFESFLLESIQHR